MRQEQRRDALQARRIEFQSATLLELQEVTSRLVRFVGRSNYHDVMEQRETGEWQRSRLPEDVDQGFTAEQTSFNRLRVRIRDDVARQLATDFQDFAVRSIMAKTSAEAEAAISIMTGHWISLNERVGILLRELDLEETP